MQFVRNRLGNRLSKQIRKLEMVNPDLVEFPPHKGETILARVLDVYDGDTVTVIILINGSSKAPFKIKVRLAGIDTPEIKTRNKLEKEAGIRVKNYVKKLLDNQIVDLTIDNWDKFGGRIVGNIMLPVSGMTLSDHLIDKGWAKPYNGKIIKSKWEDNELIEILC